VGESIICQATGSSPINTQWIPATGAAPSQGYSMTLTDAMIGVNTWTCVASNAFGNDSRQITFNVTGLQLNMLRQYKLED
jgi:hypothetical protein